jgi:recombination protein RecT
MSNTTSLQAATPQKLRFSQAITGIKYQEMIKSVLRDPARVNRYVSSIISAVAVNPAIQDAVPSSILAASLLGESLNLCPSPQLGQYYLIPFDITLKDENGKIRYILDENGKPCVDKNGKKIAMKEKRVNFVLGYKGYVQLALRSGYYKRMVVLDIKEGELISYDRLNEVISCSFIQDEAKRDKAETVGYYVMFEYLNGFRKADFWTKEKMVSHADTYSPAFSRLAYEKIRNGEIPESEMWKYSSFWYKDFDAMAKKTMLRQIISHWGIMSTELQKAFESDESMIEMDKAGNFITGKDIQDEVKEAPFGISAAELPFGNEPDNPEAPQPEMDAESVNLADL